MTQTFLFISTLEHIPWGGSEDLWYKTALMALAKGRRVYVLAFRHKHVPGHLDVLQEKGVKIFWLERQQTAKGIAGKVRNRLFPGRENRRVLNQLRNEINDLTNLSILVSQAGGFDFCYTYLDDVAHWLKETNAPINVIVQNVPDLGFTITLPMAAKQKGVFESAQTVGFVSKRNHISAERILATPIPNAYTINNPLNVETIEHPLPYPKSDSKISLATVAALRCFHKGQDILFQVLGTDAWKNRNWELNLYGEGPDEAYLKELAGYYKINDKIKFHGHVDDIRNVWLTNHIHILPSLGEGTPLALIESMYCGRPAITSDVGGNAAYCSHLQSGFIMTYPTLSEMENTLELAWEKQGQWKELGLNARNSILQKYDLNSVEKLYNRLNS